MKVLVIQQRYGIGDMVIFSPYIQAISKKCGVPVSILAKKSSKASEIFSEDDSVNEIIDLERSLDTIRGFFKLSKILKEKNFDRVYIFNGSLRYNLIAKFSGIKSVFQYPLFRSKDNFFKEAANRQLSGLTNRNKNTVDRFLRDTVVVSVHTRNIGGQGLQ